MFGLHLIIYVLIGPSYKKLAFILALMKLDRTYLARKVWRMLFYTPTSNSLKFIKMCMYFIFFQFFSKLDQLKEIALRGMSVYGTLESHDLTVLVPSIVSLDISQNLMSSWAQVALITKQLKNLKSLNVR